MGGRAYIDAHSCVRVRAACEIPRAEYLPEPAPQMLVDRSGQRARHVIWSGDNGQPGLIPGGSTRGKERGISSDDDR